MAENPHYRELRQLLNDFEVEYDSSSIDRWPMTPRQVASSSASNHLLLSRCAGDSSKFTTHLG
jgi:hypothetical protein